jgi:membrane protein implicated in regulation of membrane protease activity
MNAFLWLGVASTLVLIASLVIDGTDGIFDMLDGMEIGGDWLSLPVLAAFFGAFGFGAGAFYGSTGLLVALAVGVVIGGAFAFATTRLVRYVEGGPEHAPESEASLLGAMGRIVTVTGPTTYGEVLLARANGPTKLACRANEVLPLGTEVVVVDVTSSTLVTVAPFPQEIP